MIDEASVHYNYDLPEGYCSSEGNVGDNDDKKPSAM